MRGNDHICKGKPTEHLPHRFALVVVSDASINNSWTGYLEKHDCQAGDQGTTIPGYTEQLNKPVSSLPDFLFAFKEVMDKEEISSSL